MGLRLSILAWILAILTGLSVSSFQQELTGQHVWPYERAVGAAGQINPLFGMLNADATPPQIDVWYGSSQNFTLGMTQNWINILGNTSDFESGLNQLRYSLNHSPDRNLSIGPDNRRLLNDGDFNIDIALSDPYLIDGTNSVMITAVNGVGLTAQTTVQFTYNSTAVWEMPYDLNPQAVTDIQQAAQVVDGSWVLSPGGLHNLDVGYDRVLAVGDQTWQDYDVRMLVTIHAIDNTAYNSSISVNPGLGISMHWTGHTNDPVTCSQPKCGWNPTGASAWYGWTQPGSPQGSGLFKLMAYPPSGSGTTPMTNTMQFNVGDSFWMRVQSQKNASGVLYNAKIWGLNDPEPDWMLTKQADATNLDYGSFLLVAHYVEVTFSQVYASLDGSKPVVPPQAYEAYLPFMVR